MLMHRPQTPQPGFGSITLLQKFTPHFKILDPRLLRRVDIGLFQICLQPRFQSLLTVFQGNFSLANVTTHTKSEPSWTCYRGKLVSL